jgi:hypothetical protein
MCSLCERMSGSVCGASGESMGCGCVEIGPVLYQYLTDGCTVVQGIPIP